MNQYSTACSSLHTAKIAGKQAPHKAVLLLSIMDLVEAGATITDPEVIESVRKAALQTDFNTNFDAPELAEGTITYTFKKK